MAKIIVTYGVPADGFSLLAGHEIVIPPHGTAFSREQLIRLLPDADAVLACTALDREMIAAAKKLQLIVCYGAGYDAIDVAAATSHGIPVVNTPECVTRPPRELFGMGRRMGTSLDGSVLGVVGMGRIGGRVADFAHLMGMRVLYTARTPKPERDALGDTRVSLEDLMKNSDFITLHCPHTPQTEGMISREMIALMKPTAYLINTARGPVVDEDALIEALRAHRIAGAALDVFASEPDINPAFAALDNVLLTPHAGSNTLHARNEMARAASRRILDRLAGRIPQNLLNPEALAHEKAQ